MFHILVATHNLFFFYFYTILNLNPYTQFFIKPDYFQGEQGPLRPYTHSLPHSFIENIRHWAGIEELGWWVGGVGGLMHIDAYAFPCVHRIRYRKMVFI